MRLRLLGIGAALALTASLLTAVPANAATAPTVVSITFDDGDADQMAAATTMGNLGLKGTFYITDEWVGAAGYLSRTQVSQLAAAGNEIAGHTVTHPDLIQIDPTEAQRQICDNRAALQGWGYQPVDFAYPFSDSNSAVEGLVQGCGYNTGRGLGDIRSPKSCAGCDYAETMPPADPYYLRAPDQVDSSWTLAQLKAQVTNAVNHGGGWVILTFHHVCSNLGAADCQRDQSTTPATFNAFVTWLAQYQKAAANKTTVRTVDAVVRQYLGASYPAYQNATAVPPRPPAPDGVNALSNSSLETTDPYTGFPLCYQPGGWGSNTPAWATVSPGATGSKAEQLLMSNYVSGDAKLLPTLDLGGCSPTVVPGRTYQLSVTAQSTGVTQFALYYRDANNLWFYWTSSPWIAPMPGWTTVEFTTPAVPANAVAMTYGLALIANGTLVTDDYGLAGVGSGGPQAPGQLATKAPTNGANARSAPTVTGGVSSSTKVPTIGSTPKGEPTRGQQVVVGGTGEVKTRK